jgi:hypothetical protein
MASVAQTRRLRVIIASESSRGGFLVDVVGCLLRVSGCRECRAIIVLQNFRLKPRGSGQSDRSRLRGEFRP